MSLRAAERDTSGAVVIIKDQASSLGEDGQPSEPQAVDIERHLGWMHDEAFFDGAPLREILFQLERWHDVRFVLVDTSVASETLTLHIGDKSLDDALGLIAILTDMDYEHTGKSVVFKPKN